MNHYQTQAIVLGRTDYGEADRIIHLLTAGQGKVTVLAKGVRKVKSKLAGGVELFTVNDIVIIEGKGEISTLRSARMNCHFPNISQNYNRMQLGFNILKSIGRMSESQLEDSYYDMLLVVLHSLNNLAVQPAVTQLWFDMNFLRLQGRQPNLSHDIEGTKLDPIKTYAYNSLESGLEVKEHGQLTAEHIKFARLLGQLNPVQLMKIKGASEYANEWLKQFRMFDAV